MTDEEYLAAEFNLIFSQDTKSNVYYDIYIKNNMANKQAKCEFCKEKHSDDCLFDFGARKNDEINIDQVL